MIPRKVCLKPRAASSEPHRALYIILCFPSREPHGALYIILCVPHPRAESRTGPFILFYVFRTREPRAAPLHIFLHICFATCPACTRPAPDLLASAFRVRTSCVPRPYPWASCPGPGACSARPTLLGRGRAPELTPPLESCSRKCCFFYIIFSLVYVNPRALREEAWPSGQARDCGTVRAYSALRCPALPVGAHFGWPLARAARPPLRRVAPERRYMAWHHHS